jgi:hypothetical protein
MLSFEVADADADVVDEGEHEESGIRNQESGVRSQ